MTRADDWIRRLHLEPHPEGGFYRETYRATGIIPARPSFGGERSASTAIYFLLKSGQRSKLHRIKSDELWHFYAGDPLEISWIEEGGGLRRAMLGIDVERGEGPQVVVPAHTWFGAMHCASAPQGGHGFTLVGCTVAPGFDFADFEMGEREALVQQYPQHRDVIETLT